jgi:hypothetical protein
MVDAGSWRHATFVLIRPSPPSSQRQRSTSGPSLNCPEPDGRGYTGTNGGWNGPGMGMGAGMGS